MEGSENWPVETGEYEVCDETSAIAVCTMEDDLDIPRSGVAIIGKLRTENLGLERIVLNIVSNPKIRKLLLCGREIRGHRSGHSLISLWKNGTDDSNRIIGCEGAIPYIQNIPKEFIDRFREQVEVVDLLGETDPKVIRREIAKIDLERMEPFEGEELDLRCCSARRIRATCSKWSWGEKACISPEFGIVLDPFTLRLHEESEKED
jgi:tetrahydromethanopterin S-methyltransferase subunit A